MVNVRRRGMAGHGSSSHHHSGSGGGAGGWFKTILYVFIFGQGANLLYKLAAPTISSGSNASTFGGQSSLSHADMDPDPLALTNILRKSRREQADKAKLTNGAAANGPTQSVVHPENHEEEQHDDGHHDDHHHQDPFHEQEDEGHKPIGEHEDQMEDDKVGNGSDEDNHNQQDDDKAGKRGVAAAATDDHKPDAKLIPSKAQNKKNLPVVLTQHGSGPAQFGYVVDLAQERVAASFRTVPSETARTLSDTRDRAKEVASVLANQDDSKKKKVVHLEACEYRAESEEDDRKNSAAEATTKTSLALRQHANCRDADVPLVVYNAAAWTRYACGRTVDPGHAIRLDDEACDHRTILLGGADVATDTATPASVVVTGAASDKDGTGNDSLLTIPCDANGMNVKCQFDAKLPATGARNLHVNGTTYSLFYTKDDPYVNNQAKIERTDYRRNKYYSTTSLLSSVPLAFYDADRYDLRNTKAVSWSKAGNKATYVLDTNCQAGRRHKWFAAVDAAMKVESYGSCHHSTDLAKGETIATLKGRVELYQKNRMALAFEGGTEKDHITGIVWEALMAGSVPAIFGPTNLEQRLPPNSAIFSSSFQSWDKFAEHIKEVSEDETLWKSFHEWRKDSKALDTLERLYNFTNISPECRTCQWAYAKQNGLGWDHEQQVVRSNHLSRDLCVNSVTKEVSAPFREVWKKKGKKSSANHDDNAKSKCTESIVEGTVEIDDTHSIQRNIVEHDGVVDIVLLPTTQIESDDVVLQLEFKDLHNTDGAYFVDTHTLVKEAVRVPAVSSASVQDDLVKITVLANWATTVRSPREGIIEVAMAAGEFHDDEVRRIRIIPEDMNPLHDKMTEYFPSNFGRQMMHDFIDPLELYYEA